MNQSYSVANAELMCHGLDATRCLLQASKATQAQSRVKLIEKLSKDQVTGPTSASEFGAGDAKKVR